MSCTPPPLMLRSFLEAIELYRKANHHMEAAKLLTNLAKESAEKKASVCVQHPFSALACFSLFDYLINYHVWLLCAPGASCSGEEAVRAGCLGSGQVQEKDTCAERLHCSKCCSQA